MTTKYRMIAELRGARTTLIMPKWVWSRLDFFATVGGWEPLGETMQSMNPHTSRDIDANDAAKMVLALEKARKRSFRTGKLADRLIDVAGSGTTFSTSDARPFAAFSLSDEDIDLATRLASEGPFKVRFRRATPISSPERVAPDLDAVGV